MDLRKSLEEKVSNYAFEDYVSISMSDTIASVARAMQKAGSGEALVIRNGEPIGIVTERDILYKVVAVGRDPSKTQAGQVMSAPVEGIDEDANVADAIAKMSQLGVRRLVVMKGKKLLGMITQKRIVAGGTVQVILPELATPKGVTCPYCSAVVADEKELSKHIDQLHVGEGLLKGDRRKW
jgi:CBS domain-containing protein